MCCFIILSSSLNHIFFIYSHHCMIIWLSGCPSWETPWCELSPCLRHLWQCAEHVSLEYTGLQLLLGLWPLSFWIFRIWSLSRCLKLRSRTGKCRYTHSSPPERIDYLMYRAQSHLNVKVYIVLPYIITISTSESLNIFGWTLSKYS